jgi:hypothetical protein
MTEHRFVATERPDARPPAGSKGRANPAEAHQRTPPPAKASSRSSITSPARPQRHNAPAATRTRSNPTRPSTTTPRSHGTPTRRFSQGTDRIDHYRSTATHVNPIICRSSRTTSASASGAHIRQTESTNSYHQNDQQSVPAERRPLGCSFMPTSPGVLRTSRSPFSQTLITMGCLNKVRNRQTARPRNATNARSRVAVETLSTLRAARTQRQAPKPPHGHRLKTPSSQLTKARPLDLPVWPAATSLSRRLPSLDRWPCATRQQEPAISHRSPISWFQPVALFIPGVGTVDPLSNRRPFGEAGVLPCHPCSQRVCGAFSFPVILPSRPAGEAALGLVGLDWVCLRAPHATSRKRRRGHSGKCIGGPSRKGTERRHAIDVDPDFRESPN